jgi:uncharacterized protein YjiS (DUF1127 family)
MTDSASTLAPFPASNGSAFRRTTNTILTEVRDAFVAGRESYRRNKTAVLLSRLDDRMLQDIGVTRSDTPHYSEKYMASRRP